MPSRPLHNKVAELLGLDPEIVNLVNKVKDEPSKWAGPGHRRYRHGHASNAKVALTTKSPMQAFVAGEVHDLLDSTFDTIPGPYRRLAEDLVLKGLKKRR